MAYYFLFPEIDTTLYSHPDRKGLNTGGDEVLELVEEKATIGNTITLLEYLLNSKTQKLRM